MVAVIANVLVLAAVSVSIVAAMVAHAVSAFLPAWRRARDGPGRLAARELAPHFVEGMGSPAWAMARVPHFDAYWLPLYLRRDASHLEEAHCPALALNRSPDRGWNRSGTALVPSALEALLGASPASLPVPCWASRSPSRRASPSSPSAKATAPSSATGHHDPRRCRPLNPIRRSRRGFDAGERIVVPKLRAMGVRSVDLILLTHPDADHVGGTGAVLREYPHARLAASAAFRRTKASSRISRSGASSPSAFCGSLPEPPPHRRLLRLLAPLPFPAAGR